MGTPEKAMESYAGELGILRRLAGEISCIVTQTDQIETKQQLRRAYQYFEERFTWLSAADLPAPKRGDMYILDEHGVTSWALVLDDGLWRTTSTGQLGSTLRGVVRSQLPHESLDSVDSPERLSVSSRAARLMLTTPKTGDLAGSLAALRTFDIPEFPTDDDALRRTIRMVEVSATSAGLSLVVRPASGLRAVAQEDAG
ncbi:hypothetical protein AB0O47_39875 [Streptomyces noursei]|uniref:hypothetical protein n=1 Tax=Streptomyces noursei TaxID=1971 RepID=UPI003450F2C5